MDSVIKLFNEYFEKEEWKYRYNSENHTFSTSINMNNVLGLLKIYIMVRDRSYMVRVILGSKAEEKNYVLVSEFLHRANYCLPNGNFEIDYSDGEIAFKAYVYHSGVTLSYESVENSILTPIFMFERYGKGLLKVMLGATNVKEIIDEIENYDDTADESE